MTYLVIPHFRENLLPRFHEESVVDLFSTFLRDQKIIWTGLAANVTFLE